MDDSSVHIVRAVYDQTGSVRATSRATGLSRIAVSKIIKEVGPVYTGKMSERKTQTRELPKEGFVKYYILTSAQNNTKLHSAFWDNLVAYGEWLNDLPKTQSTEIMVGCFAYNKTAYHRSQEKSITTERGESEALIYPPELAPYTQNDSVELAPSLVWCGEMNILPTAIRPLSGLETYTGRKSGIFPHAKLALESVAQIKGAGAKLNYTTGAVTLRNYLQRKEGIRAEFHHIYGALIVGVDSDGSWYVHQLSADSDGKFYHLDRKISKGEVKENVRVEAITWADIHEDCMDDDARDMNWGKGGILDTLRPKYQFMHDSLDFRFRNHHDTKNPHVTFEKFVLGKESVETEIKNLAEFLKMSKRKGVETIIVDSNHDNAFARWLREADYREDPVNALFFLDRQLAYYTAIAEGSKRYHVLEDALRKFGIDNDVRFLRTDESFVICQSYGGIECGMHGDLGPDGTRGSPASLSRIGRRANTAHTHSAKIRDGLYVGGTCALEPAYKKGPSSWSLSHTITYENGKRAIFTCWEGKWRADMDPL